MRRIVLLVVLGLVLAPAAVATAATPRPDLRVRSVSTGSSQEAPRSLLTASATVVNVGNQRARATRLGLYLSRDRRKGRGDFRLSPRPRVSARRASSFARLRRTYRVPARIPAGNYALLACADDTRRVRERRERNNCRSAGPRIRIAVSALPGPPIPPTTDTTTTGSRSLRVSGPANGTFTLDTTPTYTGSASATGGVIARVEVGVDNGGFATAGVTCSGCGTRSATWAFSPAIPLVDGPHSFHFRAIDSGGRSSGTITRTLTVDTTGPSFSVLTAAAGGNVVFATFSEPLACITVNTFDFTAQIGATAVPVTAVGCSATSNVIGLQLGTAPVAGQVVSVTLTGVVSDRAGNAAQRPVTRTDPA